MSGTTSGDTEKVEAAPHRGVIAGSYRPMKSAALSQKDLGDGCVLYDAQKGVVYTLNRTASFILTYCNGGNTIDEIARQMVMAFGLSPEEATKDVASMISDLQAEELLESG